MKIGIISDTHDHHENIVKAVKVFRQKRVSYVLHAGDIVSPFSTRPFAKLKNARFIVTLGNNDGEKLFLKATINSFDGEMYEHSYKGEIDGKTVYMTHIPSDLDEIIKCQTYDIIIYGHTHLQDIRREGKSLIINPGETTDWITGSSHIVILDTKKLEYQVIGL